MVSPAQPQTWTPSEFEVAIDVLLLIGKYIYALLSSWPNKISKVISEKEFKSDFQLAFTTYFKHAFKLDSQT